MAATMIPGIEKAACALTARGATEVYVFGSAANGTMRPDSDVDLAVRGLPPAVFYRAASEATDALGLPVDLIDLDDESPIIDYLKSHRKLVRVA